MKQETATIQDRRSQFLLAALLGFSLLVAALALLGSDIYKHKIILQQVNSILAVEGKSLEVREPLNTWFFSGRASLLSVRYSTNDPKRRILVFTVAHGGLASSWLAIYKLETGIEQVYAYDRTAEEARRRMPDHVFDLRLQQISQIEARLDKNGKGGR